MNGEIFGRFHIEAPLGKGGMAEVWRARDPLLGRPVALKVIADHLSRSADARRRFLREAEHGRRLDHPGIVPLIEAGERDGRLWIAFELVDGETISDLADRAPLEPARAATVIAEAAEAIDHAHRRGVLHRDVTSRNIMVGRDGRARVLDFGLARALDAETFTSSGTWMGTLNHLAPEVARGERARVESDVWGLGVVLYQALTGTMLFPYDRAEALVYAIMHEPIPPPSRRAPAVPPALDEIVVAALERDWAKRIGSAAELAARLRAAAERRDPEREPALPLVVESPAARAVSRVFLAVLPFRDLGSAGDQAEDGTLLAAGFASALSAALSGRRELTLIATRDATAEGPLEAVGRASGANRVLTGDVRRSGSDVRVSWRLVDPHSGVQVAGGSVDGRIMDLFALEDRLIGAVLRALGVDRGPSPARPGGDPAAHERYLQALGHLRRYDHAPSLDAAVALLERLIETEGETAERWASLGRACLLQRRLTLERHWEGRAAAACDRALALDPDSPEVKLTRAELRLEAGEPARALEEFEGLSSSAPTLESKLGEARALEELGRIDEARTRLEAAAERDPGAWAVHQRIGKLEFGAGRIPEAIAAWERALARSPENPRTLANLGAAYFQLQRYEAAIEACERSIRSQPGARAYSNLGTALCYLGRFEEAIDALRRAAALQPADPDMWGNLGGACRLQAGHEAEARESLEYAVRLLRDRLERNPADGHAWAGLARWLSSLDRFEEAGAAIERALSLLPATSDLMLTAVYAYQTARPEQALLWLRRALEVGYGVEGVARNPALSPLRGHPEFPQLLSHFEQSPRIGRRP